MARPALEALRRLGVVADRRLPHRHGLVRQERRGYLRDGSGECGRPGLPQVHRPCDSDHGLRPHGHALPRRGRRRAALLFLQPSRERSRHDGDEVEAGETIGTMGNTGFTTPRDAYHVHVSVSMENPFYNPWDNDAESGEYKWLDPEIFLGTREP